MVGHISEDPVILVRSVGVCINICKQKQKVR